MRKLLCRRSAQILHLQKIVLLEVLYSHENIRHEEQSAANEKQIVVPAAVLHEDRYVVAALNEANLIFRQLFRTPSVYYG